MPDSRRVLTHTPHHSRMHHGRVVAADQLTALTAAAQLVTPELTERRRNEFPYFESWQREAWDFYFNLGEFNYGVEWLSQAISRVRLTVATVAPGGDEPEVLSSGAAVDLIAELAGGFEAQASLLRSFATQLTVVGDGYMVGRPVTEVEELSGVLLEAVPDPDGNVWTVQPNNTIRPGRRGVIQRARTFGRALRGASGERVRSWEIQVADGAWFELPVESLVTRVWNRNEYLPWRAFSPARPALPIMREIDMYNRHIIASLVSRVALNGIWLIPDEVTLPSNPGYEDAVDPFVAELLDVMRSAIKNPGSPAAALPIPLRVPAQYVDAFRHLTFSTPLDERIFEAREGAIKRLAATLNLPMEVLTGMGAVNHWGQWQLTEDAIKIHISPVVETITRCLTIGYLHPRLRAAGEATTVNGSRVIVWYDTSELTQRPDRSDMSLQLNDRIIINDAATRRETGFSESDAPSPDEVKTQLLRQLVKLGGQLAGSALDELTGVELATPQSPGATEGPMSPAAGPAPPNSGPGGGGGGAGTGSVPPRPAVETQPTRRRGGPPPPDSGITAGGTTPTRVERVRRAAARVGSTADVQELAKRANGSSRR